MSNHLPECGVSFACAVCGNRSNRRCICDRLRACEQRVREDERQKIRSAHLTGIQVVEVNKAYVSGYNRALDAAREAVADPGWVDRADFLAAIDALREGEK